MDGAGTSLQCLGHATFLFTSPESKRVLIDPWTFSNPLCREEDRDVGEVDVVLVTHAHHDHLGDLEAVVRQGAPTVVVVPELGRWLRDRGVRNVRTMNLGGVIEVDDVQVGMTLAAHTSSADDDPYANVGAAAGFVLAFSDGARIYHAGDTCAFWGMQGIHEVHQPDLALLPMGDHHTMGPSEAAVAARLLEVPRVVPMHYGIEPGSEQVPQRYREALDARGLRDVEVVEMPPGTTFAWRST